MQRVAVIGNSGSGKSTFAAALAERLGVPHVELDAHFHEPDWGRPDPDEFRTRIDAITAQPGWVVDGNYSAVRDLIWGRADTIVWLDLGRHVVIPRIVRRSIVRATTRQELWAGNRERFRDVLSRDPDRSVVVWSWQQHRPYRERYQSLMFGPEWRHARLVRLRSRRAIAALLASVRPA